MKKEIIREVPTIYLKDLFHYKSRDINVKSKVFSFENLEFVGSGKAGISLILRYMHQKGIYPNRTYEMLVPQWLGAWVYSQMEHYTFPVRTLSNKTKIIFIYHQYGFPQNINKLLDYAKDKGLLIIEDCAHTLTGLNEGYELGFIGEYSLYSFSKYFFCYALGAVRSSNTEFLEYVRQEKVNVKKWITIFNNATKAFYEYAATRSHKRILSFATDLTYMSYALYDVGFKPLKRAEKFAKIKIDYEIYIRDRYYRFFREKTDKLGICDHLESENVYPYMIPIYVSDKVRDRIINKLREKGFMTNVYNFDMNRFFIEPDFQPCIPIFCHSGLTESKFEEQISILLKTI